ncbi:YdcF family protein [Tepidibacter hydrothermalis]|uniref:YdcF family protein n=1 Tax=Tepidibacter hydrothermalis TaxID=3036126 RepID=A0ABY8E7N0_9FIRM|nr:YdcF family protein [Tepidibacter hydrothermalis]WFD08898.1 YdcF family protein [Tepidibacter hydrothermalis]
MKKTLITKIIKIIALILISSFIMIEGLIIINGQENKEYDVDYLVVLGSGLWGDVLSPTLLGRMNTALEFIENNPNTKIVVCGGQGRGENMPEAEAMRDYLVLNGVDESKIIQEDKSTSTLENLKFAKNILEELDGKKNHKIMIVTNEFHLFRSKFIAKRLGFTPYGMPSKTITSIAPKYFIREYFAVIKSFIFDR